VGQRLGCGAFATTLRRTHVGPFRADEGLPLDGDADTARAHLLPLGLALAELPRLVVPAGDVQRLRNGQGIAVPAALRGQQGEVGVFDESGGVVAVGLIEGGELRPAKVLA
jgi:tRNA pseudouridine55 synthase